MKAILSFGIMVSLAMICCAGGALTDITSYEAVVTDDASGGIVAVGGPWAWQELVPEMLVLVASGPGRSVAVKCWDGEGVLIYSGVLAHVDLEMPPVFPPIPMPVGVELTPDGNLVHVSVNGVVAVGDVVLEPVQTETVVAVDIKPGSATNPFNAKAKGVLPVAILGSPSVDVGQIDPGSLTLAGVAPVRWSVGDVQGDGVADLELSFRDQDVARVLAGVADRAVVTLGVAGRFKDGGALQGADIVTVLAKK